VSEEPTQPTVKASRKKAPEKVKVTGLVDLQDKWRACTRCELSCSQKSNGVLSTVIGDGLLTAEFVLVGEKPGVAEEKTGVPMCGEGGKWTWAGLQRAGISRERVYATNVVGCVPQKKEASAKQIKACMERVDDILDVIKPKAIIAIGRIASRVLTKRVMGMSAMSCTVETYNNYPVFCVTHPFEPRRQESDYEYEDSMAKVVGDMLWLRREFSAREWVEPEYE